MGVLTQRLGSGPTDSLRYPSKDLLTLPLHQQKKNDPATSVTNDTSNSSVADRPKNTKEIRLVCANCVTSMIQQILQSVVPIFGIRNDDNIILEGGGSNGNVTNLRSNKQKIKLERKKQRILRIFSALLISIIYWYFFYSRFTLENYLLPETGFHPSWHPTHRYERFPSVEERLYVYMSDWYAPPCQSIGNNKENDIGDEGGRVEERLEYTFDASTETYTITYPYCPAHPHHHHGDEHNEGHEESNHNRTLQIKSTKSKDGSPITPDQILAIYNQDQLRQCIKYSRNMRAYCVDAQRMLHHVVQISGKQQEEGISMIATVSNNEKASLPATIPIPILAQFGDRGGSTFEQLPIPIFKKFRHGVDTSTRTTEQFTNIINRDCSKPRPALQQPNNTYTPIIWKLGSKRHYDPVRQILPYDRPWDEKQQGVIWRGALTGYPEGLVQNEPTVKNCNLIPRCRLVMMHQDSKIVNVGLTKLYPPGGIIVNDTDGSTIQLKKAHANFKELLSYKALISIQGNDISSGLKWMLFSRSVVLMPPPTLTSYAMEELLKPWVHFIPIAEDYSNVEERMEWVIEHDDEAQKIAERATLFVYDLLFHEDAADDNEEIERQIMERYISFFK